MDAAWRVCLLLACVAGLVRSVALGWAPAQTNSYWQRSYFISFACERRELVISCDQEQDTETSPIGPPRYISVIHAVYGRQNRFQCSDGLGETGLDKDDDLEPWTPCGSPRKATTRLLSLRCNGKRVCRVPVVNALFGDPCPNTYKYLEVYYACHSASDN